MKRRSRAGRVLGLAAAVSMCSLPASGQTRGQGSAVPGGIVNAPPPQPPPASPLAPVRVGGPIGPPTKTKDVRPVYPAVAQQARVQGVVILEVVIGPDGNVQDAKILRSIPLLDAAALEAVRQWQFTQTLLNGMPVPVIMTVTVNFTLYDPEVPARPCSDEPSMRSPDATTPRFIRFSNASSALRKVYRLDATGKRQLFQTLVPGGDYRQDTFAGHVWVVTDEQDACKAVYLAAIGDQVTLR